MEIDGQYPIGRDPREMTREDLQALGHEPMSPLKALRLWCLDCCCDQPSEVRKCTAIKCPSWPFRMGANPWRAETSEAKREAGRQAMLRMRAHAGNPGQEPGESDDEASAGTRDREAADARSA
jgi:hypothetical protein